MSAVPFFNWPSLRKEIIEESRWIVACGFVTILILSAAGIFLHLSLLLTFFTVESHEKLLGAHKIVMIADSLLFGVAVCFAIVHFALAKFVTGLDWLEPNPAVLDPIARFLLRFVFGLLQCFLIFVITGFSIRMLIWSTIWYPTTESLSNMLQVPMDLMFNSYVIIPSLIIFLVLACSASLLEFPRSYKILIVYLSERGTQTPGHIDQRSNGNRRHFCIAVPCTLYFWGLGLTHEQPVFKKDINPHGSRLVSSQKPPIYEACTLMIHVDPDKTVPDLHSLDRLGILAKPHRIKVFGISNLLAAPTFRINCGFPEDSRTEKRRNRKLVALFEQAGALV